MSGMLLSKTFGQQQTAIDRFSKLNRQLAGAPGAPGNGRALVLHDHRHDLLDHAGVRVLARRLPRDPERPDGADDRRHRRVHHPPVAAVLPARAAAQRPGRDPGRPRALRPDLRVPGARPGDRRRARRDRSRRRSRSPAGSASATCRSRTRRRHRARAAAAEAARGVARPPRRPPPVATAPDRLAEPDAPVRRRALAPEPLPFGLRDIDFEAAPGDLVALVGPSGSGKTTTTYLVPRLYDVEEGAVEIDGVDVQKLTLVSLGRVIGFVTQETYLFHDTVRANILYAKPEADAGRARSGRARGGDPRSGDGAAAGLRHDRGRARLQAVRRREAADRDRAGAAEGPADPDPRRGHVGAGHGQRAADPARAGAAGARPDDDRDRPPPVDDPPRRPDPRLRRRAGSWSEARTPALLERGGLYARLYHEQFERGRAGDGARSRPFPGRHEAVP